jgi:acetyl esterase/lipase
MASDFSSIHSELVKVAKLLPDLTYTPRSYRFLRLLMWLAGRPKTNPSVQIERHLIPSQDGTHCIRLRVYKPRSMVAPAPVLVWMHGGGYVVGTPELSDPWSLHIVQELGISVVSVDYRLAPENPFPAALDDAYCALKWVHDQSAHLGFDADRIAIGGESAGGGLAAALAQLSHDRAEVQPVFQLLVYPMLDDRTGAEPKPEEKNHIVWNPASNRFGWDAYLHQCPGLDMVPAYSVAARREDLSGLPPAWIGVGTEDLFYAESLAYAKRLQACGVDCDLMTVPGGFHGFDGASPQLSVSQSFRRAQILALKKYLFSTDRSKDTK